jgi:hypothetical protein
VQTRGSNTATSVIVTLEQALVTGNTDGNIDDRVDDRASRSRTWVAGGSEEM